MSLSLGMREPELYADSLSIPVAKFHEVGGTILDLVAELPDFTIFHQ